MALVLFLLLFHLSLTFSSSSYETFLDCLSSNLPNSNLSQLVYNQNNISYENVLHSTPQNLRFTSQITTTKPILIFTPQNENQIQASVICCKNHNLQIRIRSGGHDYEGLSYRSLDPSRFVMVDLTNFRLVNVDSDEGTAWVESGATIGELYYEISKSSDMLAFPAGTCPTVCVGGHFSGGGLGVLIRKYGLSADNILDAKIVDSNGKILDKESMSKDLFWAIRGGGGGSFGILLAWKVRLVSVPETVTVFTINKTLNQDAIGLVHKWQHIAHKMSKDIFLKVNIEPRINGNEPSVVFKSLYLGTCINLLSYMQMNFPDLGVERSHCREMSWIQSTVYFAGFGDADSSQILLDRALQPNVFSKGTSDYVAYPIPLNAWQGIFDKFRYEGAGSMHMDPHGGMMSDISESDLPYPHRKGILYSIHYLVKWREGGDVADETHLSWIWEMRRIMTPYACRNPRRAYVNFRDLDLGRNEKGNNTSYEKARVWGEKYFTNNFRKLALVKGEFDPENFFWHEQSIPSLVITKGISDNAS